MSSAPTPETKHPKKSARSRAREFVLQGLYQYLLSGNDAASVDAFTRELRGFDKANSAHYDAVLHGSITQAQELDTLIQPLLDRPLAEISPIEHAVLWIGAYEFKYCLDVPYRVVMNECIELAKEFGGSDGHKYINGVLHHLAAQLRPHETVAA